MTIDVIISGHLCLDLIPQMGHLPLATLSQPGRLFETGALMISTGGAASNTGLALHRLGVNVRLMAAIGDDQLGKMILNVIESRDPQLSELITINPGQTSSYTVVLSPYQTDRIFLHSAGANATFGVDSIDFALLDQVKIFHLGYPPILPKLYTNDGAELVEIYRRAKAAGAVTSLDMSLPDTQSASGSANWPAIVRGVLPYVDIFMPSIDEILFMLRRQDVEAWQGRVLENLTRTYLSELADELLAMGAKIVGFKLGEMGIYLKTSGAVQLERINLNWGEQVELWSPAFEVDVVGTVGAGDSAYAGFLAAILRGCSPEQALQWACAVGACNVEAADATSGVRTWEATQARLDAGWPTKNLQLSGF